jgi:hypothetical protein
MASPEVGISASSGAASVQALQANLYRFEMMSCPSVLA